MFLAAWYILRITYYFPCNYKTDITNVEPQSKANCVGALNLVWNLHGAFMVQIAHFHIYIHKYTQAGVGLFCLSVCIDSHFLYTCLIKVTHITGVGIVFRYSWIMSFWFSTIFSFWLRCHFSLTHMPQMYHKTFFFVHSIKHWKLYFLI